MAVDALIPGAPMLFMGEGFRVHATSRETGGGFLIAEITSRPGGGPRHMHSHEAAEQYMCLEGGITVITSDGVHRLSPGESVTITPHLAHTYRNLTDTPARLLCTLSPPEDMEAFLLEVCDPHTEGVMEAAFARVPRAELYRRTGLQFMRFNSLFQLIALQRDR